MTLGLGKRALAGISMLAVAFSVGACASGPGTAVESLGVRYTERDVTVAADELAPVLQMSGQTGRQIVVNLLAQAQPVIQTAEEVGLAGPDDVDMAAEQILGRNADELGRATRDILLTSLYAGQVGPVVNPDALFPPETIINPRYGELSPATGQLDVPTLGDVVTMTGQQ